MKKFKIGQLVYVLRFSDGVVRDLQTNGLLYHPVIKCGFISEITSSEKLIRTAEDDSNFKKLVYKINGDVYPTAVIFETADELRSYVHKQLEESIQHGEEYKGAS